MPGYLCITHPFATLHRSEAFDLHVLGTPPAFILSQDQTLHCPSISSDNFGLFSSFFLLNFNWRCVLFFPVQFSMSSHSSLSSSAHLYYHPFLLLLKLFSIFFIFFLFTFFFPSVSMFFSLFFFHFFPSFVSYVVFICWKKQGFPCFLTIISFHFQLMYEYIHSLDHVNLLCLMKNLLLLW